MPPPSKKFVGALAEPIVVSRSFAGSIRLRSDGVEVLTEDEAARLNDAEMDRAAWEAVHKLTLLAQHYGIKLSPDDEGGGLGLLAMALAKEFVPGFSVTCGSAAKPGRKRDIWTFEAEVSLIADVEHEMRRLACGQRDAIKSILTHPDYAKRWSRFRVKGRTNASLESAADSLVTRFREAKRKNYFASLKEGVRQAIFQAISEMREPDADSGATKTRAIF